MTVKHRPSRLRISEVTEKSGLRGKGEKGQKKRRGRWEKEKKNWEKKLIIYMLDRGYQGQCQKHSILLLVTDPDKSLDDEMPYFCSLYYTSFIRQKNGSKHKSNRIKSRACANNNHSWFQLYQVIIIE